MDIIEFVNNRARPRLLRIGQFVQYVAPNRTVLLEARFAGFARSAGLEVVS